MNETYENLISRRSVRKYLDTEVPEDILEKILEAGTYAPTGMNRQSPIMVVLTKKEDIDKVEMLNSMILNGASQHPFYNAPCVVIVFADKNVPTFVEDGSLVMGNLLNCAHSFGIASCWINRAREVFNTEEGRALMQKWGIPDNYEGIGNCILGYLDGDYPEKRPRKEKYIYRV